MHQPEGLRQADPGSSGGDDRRRFRLHLRVYRQRGYHGEADLRAPLRIVGYQF